MNRTPKISIPNPCTENWAAMIPDEKGRYCSACQTSVQDFTSLSDSELISFFKQKQIPACGRFAQRQLEILNSQDKPNANIVKRISKYAAAALIGAAILPQNTTAQKAIIQDSQPELEEEETRDVSDTVVVAGMVSDENRSPVVACYVRLKDGFTGTFTDELGKYEIAIPRVSNPKASPAMIFESFGLESKVVEIIFGKELNVQLAKSEVIFVDEILMYGGIHTKPTLWQRITRPFKRLFR